MNIAYFIYQGEYHVDGMFDVCIRSLKKQTDCKIIVYTPGLINQNLLENHGVEVVNFPKEDIDGRMMTCKVEKVYELMLNSNPGDNIMCFDSDLIFLKDPFDVFSEKFDFFYTTRHYSYFAKVNGGVWGLKVNQMSQMFMKFYVDNLNHPSWEPYINFRKNHPYDRDLNTKNWWVDQDFLCVCHMHKDQINNTGNFKIFDATSKYNYIVTGLSNDEIDKEVKNKDKYILHFKANSHGRWAGGGDDALRNQDKKMLDIL